MNKLACKDCRFFHEQYVFKALRRMPANYGYCAKQSKYPQKDADLANPPPCDVVRVESDGRPHLVVVNPSEVRTHCMHAAKKGG